MQQITCPQCNQAIEASGVNLDIGTAVCQSCNAVFNLGQQAGGASQPAKPDVQMPKKVTVTDLGDRLILSWRWFSAKMFFLIPFVIFWDGFLVFWYFMAFTQEDTPLMMKLFPIIHLLVGVGLTYYVIAGILNTTTVRVNVHELIVKHSPIPWPGKKLDPARIQQLFCKEKVNRSKNGTHITYQLHAATIDGDKTKLISGLEDAEQALAMERKLEDWLGLEDQHVAGEYKGV